MKRIALSLVMIVSALSALSIVGGARAEQPVGVPATAEPYLVSGHTDGDTLLVERDGEQVPVQLIGLNAPEPDDCFGAEATARLEKIAPEGLSVYLEADTRDRDGKQRLLRYLWIPGKAGKPAYLLNTKLVRDGFARAQPTKENSRYDENLAKAQSTAQKNDAGIWEDCLDVEPTDAATQGFTFEELAYANDAGVIAITVGECLTELGGLLQNAEFGSDEWAIGVAADLVCIRLAYQDALALSPPPAFEEIHSLLLGAMSLYNDATYQFSDGIDTLDLSLIAAASDSVIQANDLLAQASAAIDELQRERGL